MKLWVDDERPAPDDSWTIAKTSVQANLILHWYMWDAIMSDYAGVELSNGVLDTVSLDGDLGGDDSGELVLDYMIQHKIWPAILVIHTANPVKRARMLSAAKSIGADAPEGVVIRARYW